MVNLAVSGALIFLNMQHDRNAQQRYHQSWRPHGKPHRNITVNAERVYQLRAKINHKSGSNARNNHKHYAALPHIGFKRKNSRDQSHRH